MKLCHIFTSSQSAYCFMDGQFQYMVSQGIVITVLIPDDGFYNQLVSKYPMVKFIRSPIVRNISFFNDFKALLFFTFFLLKFRFDIIHLHTPKAGLLGGLAARITFCSNIVFQLHGLVSVKGGVVKKNITYFMEKLSLKLAHKVLAVSPSLMEFCIDNKLCTNKKIVVLNNGTVNGIDIHKKFNSTLVKPRAAELKCKLNLQEKFVLGFLGRINIDKGIIDIIACFKEVNKRHENAYLLLVGNNEIGQDLFNLLLDLPQDTYKIIPHVDDPAPYLSMFDIQLCPSYREGFGLVFAEASALGTPSVAYDVFGVSDSIINSETGTLVNFGDIEALQFSVLNYIDNPSLLSLHSAAGISYVADKFQQQPLLDEQLQFYKALFHG